MFAERNKLSETDYKDQKAAKLYSSNSNSKVEQQTFPINMDIGIRMLSALVLFSIFVQSKFKLMIIGNINRTAKTTKPNKRQLNC